MSSLSLAAVLRTQRFGYLITVNIPQITFQKKKQYQGYAMEMEQNCKCRPYIYLHVHGFLIAAKAYKTTNKEYHEVLI